MEWLTKLLAERCENCPLCRYARREPDSLVGRLVAFHGRFCPCWQAREKVYGEAARRVETGKQE